MTEWKRPFKQWAQKTCKIEGRRMEEEEREWGWEGGGRFQEGRAKQGEMARKKGKSIKKKKGVLGAPVFQVTPDLDLLCQPSARLSGGFVRASPLNCHPADRHVVYSLYTIFSVCYGQEGGCRVCVQAVKGRCAAFIHFFLLLSAIGTKKKPQPTVDERKVRFVRVSS